MRSFRSYTSVLTVLLLVGIGAGCENGPQIAGPSDEAAQFAPGSANAKGGPHTASTPVVWTSDFTGAEAFATLTAGGGTLEIKAGNDVIVALIVPGGAAPGAPVEFTMALACDANLACEVQLNATRNGRDASFFRKGVELRINLNYLAAGGSITIAEVRGNGRYAPVPTTVEGDFLVGTLSHFSAYVPITD